MTKEDVLKIIHYSNTHCVPEKEAVKILGYHITNLNYYKHKFNINVHPTGNAPFTARIKRKYIVDDNFFQTPNILNCYYAGFIAADGNISGGYKTLTIGLSTKDEHWLQAFQKSLKNNSIIHQYISRENFKTSYLAIRSSQICNDLLTHFNITQCKSLTLQPPNIVDDTLINAFICGYIDGDGSIIEYKNKHGYNTIKISLIGTLEMCTWIKRHFDNLVNCHGTIIHKPNSNKNTYVLSYSTKSARTIFENLYNIEVPKLERKWKESIYNFCINFKKHSPKGKAKGVFVFNLYGHLLKFCNTLHEAEEYTKVHFSRISSLCNQDNHHESNGYMFSRENHKEKYIPTNYYWLNREKILIAEGKIKEGDFPIITNNKN